MMNRLSDMQIDWMSRPTTRSGLWALLVLMSVAGHAGAAPVKQTNKATRVSNQVNIAPQSVGQYCVDLERGQVVRYRFEAERTVDFDIRTDRKGETLHAVRQSGVEEIAYIDFKPDQPGYWCWTWTNHGVAPSKVRYILFVAPPSGERRK